MTPTKPHQVHVLSPMSEKPKLYHSHRVVRVDDSSPLSITVYIDLDDASRSTYLQESVQDYYKGLPIKYDPELALYFNVKRVVMYRKAEADRWHKRFDTLLAIPLVNWWARLWGFKAEELPND